MPASAAEKGAELFPGAEVRMKWKKKMYDAEILKLSSKPTFLWHIFTIVHKLFWVFLSNCGVCAIVCVCVCTRARACVHVCLCVCLHVCYNCLVFFMILMMKGSLIIYMTHDDIKWGALNLAFQLMSIM